MATVTIGAETEIVDKENLKIIVQNAKIGTEFSYKMPRKTRTNPQNAALHKYCELLAVALNDAGYEMQVHIMGRLVSVPWTMPMIKDNVWRPIQIAMTNVESTADADIRDYSEVHKVLSREMSTHYGVYVPWPNKHYGVNYD